MPTAGNCYAPASTKITLAAALKAAHFRRAKIKTQSLKTAALIYLKTHNFNKLDTILFMVSKSLTWRIYRRIDDAATAKISR
ncbi:hypothetical protein KJI95_07395 [Shewanella sp. JM162201]|uniref:Uncharacterized protein n=1 Tax=Shewanella jiangmenensis TaxID=2837387 RepID=A0ABS5V346_9GAMM|nr:hypothetical protein [Shewanella jiangmenensis]MBT1444350.1 hypothetical protein [Shewanella jiangmenensis]